MVKLAAAALVVAALAGNPTSAAPYWQLQTTADCAEETVRMAADQLGHPVTEAAVDAEAQRLGIYTLGLGTVWSGVPELVHHYGLGASGPAPMSKARLIWDLQHGAVVIASVNAETIWNPEGFRTDAPTTKADHAVVIEALEGSTAVLADTGVPVGDGERVPWARFLRAWSTSGRSAIVVRK